MKRMKIKDLMPDQKASLFNRFGEDFISIMIDTVVPIVQDIKKRGDDAVREYSRKFDGAELNSLITSPDEIEDGYNKADVKVIDAFKKAKENIEEFHLHQKKEGFRYTRENTGLFGLSYQAVDSAAIYVPGGKAAYPSSVLMGLIPAQIAGVKEIMLITPVKKEGKIPDTVAAICRLLGVNRVLKAGGVQGIAAAGFGTESVSKAQIIVGPGNIYVTAAKSYLFSIGAVQIDSMAGPSETLVIADEKANPAWVAYDLLSQAEHEENAKALLICFSDEFASNVLQEIDKNLSEGKGRIDIKKASIKNHFTVLVADSMSEAIDFSNHYAPEHMQLMVEDPLIYLDSIRNVGSLFLGYYSPVAVGDYFSGTNHVLPTGGACRYSSGLSVETFYRRMTYQMLTQNGLQNAVGPVSVMSDIEGFSDMHGGSLRIRFGGN
jgi:histidinol dehydrogenase